MINFNIQAPQRAQQKHPGQHQQQLRLAQTLRRSQRRMAEAMVVRRAAKMCGGAGGSPRAPPAWHMSARNTRPKLHRQAAGRRAMRARGAHNMGEEAGNATQHRPSREQPPSRVPREGGGGRRVRRRASTECQTSVAGMMKQTQASQTARPTRAGSQASRTARESHSRRRLVFNDCRRHRRGRRTARWQLRTHRRETCAE